MKLIGLAELAELYGVSKNTASTWSRQRDWPTPVATLKMGPVWDQDQVEAHRSPPGDASAHVPVLAGKGVVKIRDRSCMICSSLDTQVIPGSGELRTDAQSAVLEYSYHCNTCQADVDRYVDLTKEDA